jgi:hypothetical protein
MPRKLGVKIRKRTNLSDLEEEFNTVPGNEKGKIGGDLNGHVGRDRIVENGMEGGVSEKRM